MNDRVSYLTKEGLAKLKEELHHLVHIRRREIATRIQEAKELGDLSENAEYQEAKNEQAFNEGRIEEIENMLRNVSLIEADHPTNGFVQVGSSLEVEHKGQSLVLHIVGSNEADPTSGRISNESPLGRALLGKRRGEVITVDTPRGAIAYTIKHIK